MSLDSDPFHSLMAIPKHSGWVSVLTLVAMLLWWPRAMVTGAVRGGGASGDLMLWHCLGDGNNRWAQRAVSNTLVNQGESNRYEELLPGALLWVMGSTWNPLVEWTTQ